MMAWRDVLGFAKRMQFEQLRSDAKRRGRTP